MRISMKFPSTKALGLSITAGAFIAAAGLGVQAVHTTIDVQAAPAQVTPEPPPPPSPPPAPPVPTYDPNQDYWTGQGSAGGAPGGAGGG
jgi:hypothetical protein